jgi:hypothetical protein
MDLYERLRVFFMSLTGQKDNPNFISAQSIKRFTMLLVMFMGGCTTALHFINPVWAPTTLAKFGISIVGIVPLYIASATFFVGYVASVNIYQQHLNGTLPMAGYVLGAPFLALFLLMDVFFQYTVFSVAYMEWPPKKEYTVTARLKRWKQTDPTSLHGRWSTNLCKLLNLFTPPNSPHC